MDFMTIIGLFAGAATVYYVMAAGNILHMLLNPVAAILVFGGTISATMIAYPWDVLKQTIPSIRHMFLTSNHTYPGRLELIDFITSLAEKARRSNVESLQDDLANISNPFLSNGIQMLVDGLESDVIRDTLEKDVIYTKHRHQKICNVFRTMATMSPIFGLLGTLIGIVQVLKNLADPTSMGNAMAIAITTTFYGIFAANFLFLPLSIKLNEFSDKEVTTMELITEGVLAIQKGDLPMIVRKKLTAFVMSHSEGSFGTIK